MKNRTTISLIGVNLGLATLVVILGLNATSNARTPAQPERARGAYTMVAGSVQGGSNDVAYIIDSTNQELICVGWENARTGLSVIGYRNLAVDARQRGGGR